LKSLDDEENSLFGGASDIDDDDSEKKKDGKSGGTTDGDKKNLFRKELRAMLYGFGDDKVPNNETLTTRGDRRRICPRYDPSCNGCREAREGDTRGYPLSDSTRSEEVWSCEGSVVDERRVAESTKSLRTSKGHLM